MKKRKPDKFWFPWWPDKWIFGSIRVECTIEERAIWVDLLSLASKDNGYIRANEETPYPIEQLAGMLMVPQDILANAIDKFIKLKDKDGNGKLTKTKYGTLYVTKWEKYQFSDRWIRKLKEDSSEKTEQYSEESEAILNNNTSNNNKENNNKEYPPEFESFWNNYPKKKEKKDAYITWKTLTKKQQEEVIIAAKHYKMETDTLETQETYIKFPKTFLNKKKEKWKDYMEPPKIKKRMTAQEKEDEKIKDWARKEE